MVRDFELDQYALTPTHVSDFEELMSLILDLRNQSKNNKDWETADQIRNQLAELSIELKDSKSGTTWQRQ